MCPLKYNQYNQLPLHFLIESIAKRLIEDHQKSITKHKNE